MGEWPALLRPSLSLFLGKFNSVNGHLRYHLCPEAATDRSFLSLSLSPLLLPFPQFILRLSLLLRTSHLRAGRRKLTARQEGRRFPFPLQGLQMGL